MEPWAVSISNLRVDDKYFALWYANLSVTELISVSVPKTRIKGIVIRREKRFNILENMPFSVSEQEKH